MKGQIVANFIIDHAVVEIPLNYLELEHWKLYFDDSSHNNGTGVGVLIVSPNKVPMKFKVKIEGSYSINNVEYEASIVRLEILLDFGDKRVKIKGDYELVVKKITKNIDVLRKTRSCIFL